jgi:hypothetical protein
VCFFNKKGRRERPIISILLGHNHSTTCQLGVVQEEPRCGELYVHFQVRLSHSLTQPSMELKTTNTNIIENSYFESRAS